MSPITFEEKTFLRWVTNQVRQGNLSEQFRVYWVGDEPILVDDLGRQKAKHPPFTRETLDTLAAENHLVCIASYRSSATAKGLMRSESSRRCLLTNYGRQCADSGFPSRKGSQLTCASPLADLTDLDHQLEHSCLPLVDAARTDPTLWDAALHAAGEILEKRIRTVGRIEDPECLGCSLVSRVFSRGGTLAGAFPTDSGREVYRDLFTDVIGAFRDPDDHGFAEPSPEDVCAYIAFVNQLLKKLDTLVR